MATPVDRVVKVVRVVMKENAYCNMHYAYCVHGLISYAIEYNSQEIMFQLYKTLARLHMEDCVQ